MCQARSKKSGGNSKNCKQGFANVAFNSPVVQSTWRIFGVDVEIETTTLTTIGFCLAFAGLPSLRIKYGVNISLMKVDMLERYLNFVYGSKVS